MRAFLFALLLPASALAVPCPTGLYPKAEWATRDVSVTRAAEIAALESYAFTLTGTDAARNGIRTNALVIIKGGELIYEKYARGWDAEKRHIGWSVTKSVTAALTGVAVKQGVLGLDDSICSTLGKQRDEVCAIKVRHLLEYASGFDWLEEYEEGDVVASSVAALLYGEGRRDAVQFVLDHRFYDKPGRSWRYSTGEATVLAAVAKTALAKKLGKDWAWRGLFDVLGMRKVVFEEDLKGAPLGGSYVFATPRDFARFGYLFLRDGCWQGARLLPEGWVATSTTPSASFSSSTLASLDTPNGWMWWLNRAAGPVKEKPWKDAPDDAYSAIGHWGQYVVVIPSADVVIVRTGDDRNQSIHLSPLISLSLAVAK